MKHGRQEMKPQPTFPVQIVATPTETFMNENT